MKTTTKATLLQQLKAESPVIAKKIFYFMSSLLILGVSMWTFQSALPSIIEKYEVYKWMIAIGLVGAFLSQMSTKEDETKPAVQKAAESLLKQFVSKKLETVDLNVTPVAEAEEMVEEAVDEAVAEGEAADRRENQP